MPQVNIALCCDANYLRPAAVTMQSVIETAKQPSALHFWLLTPGIDPARARPVEELVRQGGAGLTIIDCSREHDRMQSARIDRHLTTAAYYRLFLPDLLPPEIDRVVYLDCDLIVLAPIETLHTTDLAGACLGAVINPRPSTFHAVDLARPDDYFNSGVLLLDLERLRVTGEHRQAAEFAANNPTRIPGHDQDALNQIIAGRWHRLDLRWNQQYKFFQFNAAQLGFSAAELRRARKEPFIAHFASKSKPWHYDNTHPFRSLWFETLDRTPFAGWRPRARGFPERARRLALQFLPCSLHPEHLRNEYRPRYHQMKQRCRDLFLSGKKRRRGATTAGLSSSTEPARDSARSSKAGSDHEV